MASALLWKDFSVQQMEKYIVMKDPALRMSTLVSMFGLSDKVERDQITLDLYFYTLQFGLDKGFTADKLSVLFSIMKSTHESSMGKFWPARRSFEFFRDLLLQHSVQRPPYSIGLFSLQDVKAITDHAATGYFRHYMLYKYAFTKKTEMRFSTVFTHTMSVPESVPPGFMQPLSAAEDEDEKLKREEEAAIAQLSAAHAEVSMEELVAAGVPEDIREQVLTKVNTKLVDMQTSMETKLETENQEMKARIAELEKMLRNKDG
mmetsp:Transcript_62348/g.146983  ORF Transcript_62348/g.146983 Transcript_62348/m.146983 type:complete len:261 (+) Transcript_62348:106-888(+)